MRCYRLVTEYTVPKTPVEANSSPCRSPREYGTRKPNAAKHVWCVKEVTSSFRGVGTEGTGRSFFEAACWQTWVGGYLGGREVAMVSEFPDSGGGGIMNGEGSFARPGGVARPYHSAVGRSSRSKSIMWGQAAFRAPRTNAARPVRRSPKGRQGEVPAACSLEKYIRLGPSPAGWRDAPGG